MGCPRSNARSRIAPRCSAPPIPPPTRWGCEPSRVTDGAMTPVRSVFVILSYEGPDVYSEAGGLGVRVKGLSRTLARLGYETHLFFIGDPHLPSQEVHE